METANQKKLLEASSLKSEIDANEVIIENYLNTAKIMKHLAIATCLISVPFFVKGLVLVGFCFLTVSFLCVRKYNRSIGMAEVYFGVTKFLKLMYQKEVTGDNSLPSFLQ